MKAISKNIPQLTWVEFEPNLWKYQVGRKKRYQSWKWEKLKFNKTVERNTKNPYRISDRIKIRSVEQEKVDCYAFQNFSFSILKCLEVFLQHSAPERWKEKWKWLRALPAWNAENGTFMNWIERIIRRIKGGRTKFGGLVDLIKVSEPVAIFKCKNYTFSTFCADFY